MAIRFAGDELLFQWPSLSLTWTVALHMAAAIVSPKVTTCQEGRVRVAVAEPAGVHLSWCTRVAGTTLAFHRSFRDMIFTEMCETEYAGRSAVYKNDGATLPIINI